MRATLKRIAPYAGIWIILLFMCYTYYAGGLLLRLPYGIHEWAQADRLSIALSYYDNGMDFFRPATFNLASEGGITGVEFPLQAYIAAALGQLFGRESISLCFRLTGIAVAFAGLYALFLAVYRPTRHFALAAFVPVMLYTSPVFVVYSAAYQPDPFAAGLCFIAFYFLTRFLLTGAFRAVLAAIAFAGLAALVKTTTAPCFAGISLLALLYTVRRGQWKQSALVLAVAGFFGALAAFWLLYYIPYLNERFDAHLFQAKPNPFQSWKELGDYIDGAFKPHWMHEYFLSEHWPVLLAMIVTGLSCIRRGHALAPAWWPAGVMLAGLLCFFYLFGSSLSVHDYYFPSLGLPVITLLLLLAVLGLHGFVAPEGRRKLGLALSTAMAVLFFLADHQIYQRLHLTEKYSREAYASLELEGGAALLDSLGVGRQERLLFAGGDPPNLALVYFDRKGMVMAEDWWQQDAAVARQVMEEKGFSMLAFPARDWEPAMQKDSMALKSFDLLARTDRLVVMRRAIPDSLKSPGR